MRRDIMTVAGFFFTAPGASMLVRWEHMASDKEDHPFLAWKKGINVPDPAALAGGA